MQQFGRTRLRGSVGKGSVDSSALLPLRGKAASFLLNTTISVLGFPYEYPK